MATLNFQDPETGQFVSISRIIRGDKGDKGDKGDTGAPGGMGPIDALQDVTAPANTPAGKLLGTVNTGQWGAVDPPPGLDTSAGDARYLRLAGGTLTGGLTATTIAATAITATTVTASGTVSAATPTASGHAATKGYVDGRIWSGTQAQYNAIPTKDPAVLYIVVP
jgi:hypothetical protein